MSTILAIETSTEFCSVALLHDATCFALDAHAGNGHSGRILEMVREVLAQAHLQLKDCDALAFGAGPGSFTGLRVACSVAQGLAFGADLPVLAVGSLKAMAEQLRLETPDFADGMTVLSALDARMGEAYWSVLEWRHQEWRELVMPSLDFPAAICAQLAEMNRPKIDHACGSALRVFASEWSGLSQNVSNVEVPHARCVAALAVRAWMRGEAQLAQDAAPLYVRNRVALTTSERAEKNLLKRADAALDAVTSPTETLTATPAATVSAA
jgi:tRNA threonylcarbamoyladenosine biosynthesis protein TsaB